MIVTLSWTLLLVNTKVLLDSALNCARPSECMCCVVPRVVLRLGLERLTGLPVFVVNYGLPVVSRLGSQLSATQRAPATRYVVAYRASSAACEV